MTNVKISPKNVKIGPKKVIIVQRDVKFCQYRSENIKTGQRRVKIG